MILIKRLFNFLLVVIFLVGCQAESTPETEQELEQDNIKVEQESDVDTFARLIDTYQPFTDYDMYHDGTGLGEGMNFLAKTDQIILAEGHQGQALAFYRILKIDSEAEAVFITHEFQEGTVTFDSIRLAIEEEDRDPLLVLEEYQYEEQNKEQLFFSATEEVEETILMSGEDVAVLPVYVDETVYYFSEGKGLVRILYQSESVIDLFGEEQMAEANPHL
ncbi:hypothetical protein [Halalkalibacter akibai]|uniref:DUF3298 domain-containing protein n=1 Tax=Halalkalibacter akibai (strain ATCC 43226 / DSM 21942 / CIP 109018 / JCM 9157 / 1139) TaxID=1236973 RepID=W4QSI3_HALA3|nr:hypothetical protein [Halalkalibacter akibai]GAE34882.1 hypothetical protein JCM9157_1964 [Halalkalibacter akibai JCM 9157]